MTRAKYEFVPFRTTNASKVKNNPPPKTFHLLLLLQDSLSKFVGRTLKDCGEDLLVEISEILFNELAFFRLMQDLDNSNSNSSAAKHKSKKTNEQPSKEKQSPKVRFSVWCNSLFVFCVTLCFHSFLYFRRTQQLVVRKLFLRHTRMKTRSVIVIPKMNRSVPSS